MLSTPCKDNLERSAGRSGSTLQNVVRDPLRSTQTQILQGLRARAERERRDERAQVRQRRDKLTTAASLLCTVDNKHVFRRADGGWPTVVSVVRILLQPSSVMCSGTSEAPSNEEKPLCPDINSIPNKLETTRSASTFGHHSTFAQGCPLPAVFPFTSGLLLR